MTEQKHTFCRICEPYCPMLATTDNARGVVALEPNRDHPSGGVACHKGLSFLAVHNDPDRLNWPMKRLNSRSETRGDFERIDWGTAITDVADKLNDISKKYGPDSIAVYCGNPWFFNSPGFVMGNAFQDAIGTRMRFTAGTMDTSNKRPVAGGVYGSMGIINIPDTHYTDYLLLLGSNPKVSRWTYCTHPNDSGDVLKKIKARGGTVRFVNPRKIESSTEETGETLRIKPGTDVYFLAALLNEIHNQNGFDRDLLAQYGLQVDELVDFVKRYPGERVEDVIGVAADTVRQIAAEIVAAKSAAVYMATGVNQSRQGVLSYWLVEMLNFATGNLGRKGGTHKPKGVMNIYEPFRGEYDNVETSLGTLSIPSPISYMAQPHVLLPDLVENGDVRAFLCLGGNPLLSMGGESRMRQAFQKLDLMVSVDILPSASTEISDYVLPATDFLERADINLNSNGTQPIPYVQYVDAVAKPAHERRNEWWIMAHLLQAMGLPSPLDDPNHANGLEVIENILGHSDLSIEKMRASPQQTVMFPQESREDFFDRCLLHEHKKIDCFPEAFTTSGLIERCESIFAELQNEPADALKLITRRTDYMHNTWLANLGKLRRGKQCTNPLYMSDSDATARDLFDGDSVRVFNDFGNIEAVVQIDNDLRPGAVAMTHGYGHSHAFGLTLATQKPGVNCNELLPIGPETFEPLSNMGWVSAVPVNVEKLEVS